MESKVRVMTLKAAFVQSTGLFREQHALRDTPCGSLAAESERLIQSQRINSPINHA